MVRRHPVAWGMCIVCSGLIMNPSPPAYAQYCATCSLHCDSKYRGYYGPRVRVCLTVFCAEPVSIKVIKANMRLTGANPEKVRRQRRLCVLATACMWTGSMHGSHRRLEHSSHALPPAMHAPQPHAS